MPRYRHWYSFAERDPNDGGGLLVGIRLVSIAAVKAALEVPWKCPLSALEADPGSEKSKCSESILALEARFVAIF